MATDRGIVSVHLVDGTSRTISVTSRTTVANVIELLLQKQPGLVAAEHSLLALARLAPAASVAAVADVGTTLAEGDRVLDVQQSWGERNPAGNRFKLVNKANLVSVMFRGVPEVEDGTFGAVHSSPAVTADALCEAVALDYALSRKKKYQLLDALDQSAEDRVLGKDEKPMAVRALTIKTFNVPAEHYYFVLTAKQDNWFFKAASKLLGVKQDDATSRESMRVVQKRVSVGVPVLLATATDVEEDATPMPPEDELNKQFTQLLTELNIKDDVRARMLGFDAKRKWKLIRQHRVEAGAEKGGPPERKDPVQYIELIQKKATQHKTLVSLRVELNNAPVSWIRQFLDSQGLAAIQAVLQKIFERRQHKLDTDEDVQLEGLRCVRGIMNTEPGLREVLATPPIVHNIAYCLAAMNEKVPMLAQELMAALCILSPRGHALVLESMGLYATAFEEQFRFQTILEYVGGRKHQSYELQSMALSLVNAIVNAPENISARIKLREELQRRGFNHILQKIRHDAPPELATQINVYAEESEADAADASTVLQSKGYDLNNPMDVAAEVIRRVQAGGSPPVGQHLLSVLQNLVVLSPEAAGVRDWLVMDVFLQKLAQYQGQATASGWSAMWTEFLRAVEEMTGLVVAQAAGSDKGRATAEAELATLKSRLQEKDATIVSLSAQLDRIKLDLAEALNRQQSGDATTGYLQTIADLNSKVAEYEEQLAHVQSDAQKYYQTQLTAIATQHQHEVAEVMDQIELLKRQHNAEVRELLAQVEASPAALLEAQNEVKRLQALLLQNGDARSTALQAQLNESLSKQAALEKAPAAQRPQDDPAVQNELEALRNEVAVMRRQLQAAQKTSARMSMLMSPATLDKALEAEGIRLPGAPADTGASLSEAPAPPPPPPPAPPGPGAAPPPPPPPGAATAASGLPAKKAIKPKVPLKQLNWTKIPNPKISETIWKAISDEGVRVNTSELEALFAKAAAPVATPAVAAKPEAQQPAVAKKPTTVTLLDMNRANNIGIMLARLKLPNSEIKAAILSMDEAKLSVDVLRMLKQFVPTDEELETVREYDGDIGSLGAAEKYFREIADIPRFGARLNTMIFVRRFASSVEEVKPDIETISRAVAEVRQSRKLAQILQTCLAIGNYLNGSTFRGEAYGFKLDALSKLGETKASDGVTTLLHYLARTLEQQDPALLDFFAAMPSVDAAGRLSLPTVLGAVKELQAGMGEIEKLLKAAADGKPAAGDQFVPVMQQFLEDSHITLQALVKEADTAEHDYKQLLALFAEEDATQPEDFFPILVRFAQDLKRAQKDNGAPKSSLGAQTAALAAAAAAAAGGPAGALKVPGMPVLEKGELDNALKGLREGNAFRRKRENRRSQVYSGEQTLPSDALLAAEKLRKAPPPAVAKKPTA